MTPSPAPITGEMTIPEIVSQYPQTREVFLRHGVQVDGYRALEHENLFATSRVHQWNLPEILAELNEVVR